MKKTIWITLFLLVLILDLIGVCFRFEAIEFISKPLLIPLLTVYLLLQTRSSQSNLKPWIILALFFSWSGDMFLMFEEKRSVFFLLGLSAFTLAQLSYIIFFHGIRMREYIRGNALLLLPVVVYYCILISILSPFLHEMKLPVQIYAVILSFMWMLAMHTLLGKNKKAGAWMMSGATLFVTSDSLLAFNKFYLTFDYAGVIIMLTYALAQLFIVHGAIKYLRSESSD